MADSRKSPPEGYTLHPGHPAIPDYLNLRRSSGLSPVTPAQATGAVSGSWYGCMIKYTPLASSDPSAAASELQPEPTVVAMGRIISDGGWYFHIADMAVLPEHQRKGLGAAILEDLLRYIKDNAAEGVPYVNLFADPPGRKLYTRKGFVDGMELEEMGMVLKWDAERE